MGLQNKKNIHPLEYSNPNPAEVAAMNQINELNKAVYVEADRLVEDSAEKTLALRHLQSFRMMINSAITLNGLK